MYEAQPPTVTPNVVSGNANENIYHRPLLSMPPVVLMGGTGSVPPSPIIEMPPSPAPSHIQIVMYPDDDESSCDEVRFSNGVEVRFKFSNFIVSHVGALILQC